MRSLVPYLCGLVVCTLFGVGSSKLEAHALAPVLLTLHQEDESNIRVVWSFSRDVGGLEPGRLSINTGEYCSLLAKPELIEADMRWVREEQYRCGDLKKREVQFKIEGLNRIDTTVAIRFLKQTNGAVEERIRMLKAGDSTFNLGGTQSGIFWQYTALGIQHILSGPDHILFIILLCFLAGGSIRRLLWPITAFTLAHSITLGAAVLGWINLPGRPVEALIALSIALVAADLVKQQTGIKNQLGTYWPIVFVFGLLHGLGFAGALSELGADDLQMLPMLFAFNIGVELGQVAILVMGALILLLVSKWADRKKWLKSFGYIIGSTASFWFIARILQ